MRVLIVEDETVAAENLTYLLRKAAPEIEVVSYTESVEKTVEWLATNSVDLIFMDIHLSDGSAFMIFDRTEVTAPIVFTTAYDQYALDAFRVNSIDYLLKPIKPEDLRRALDKFRQLTPVEFMKYLSQLNALSEKPRYSCRLLVQERDQIHPVAVSDICCIYSTNKHTEIILKSGIKLTTNKSLDQIMSTLDPTKFIRANKQFIVAREAICDLTIWFDSRLKVNLITDTPEPLFISKNRVAEFKEWLTK